MEIRINVNEIADKAIKSIASFYKLAIVEVQGQKWLSVPHHDGSELINVVAGTLKAASYAPK